MRSDRTWCDSEPGAVAVDCPVILESTQSDEVMRLTKSGDKEDTTLYGIACDMVKAKSVAGIFSRQLVPN